MVSHFSKVVFMPWSNINFSFECHILSNGVFYSSSLIFHHCFFPILRDVMSYLKPRGTAIWCRGSTSYFPHWITGFKSKLCFQFQLLANAHLLCTTCYGDIAGGCCSGLSLNRITGFGLTLPWLLWHWRSEPADGRSFLLSLSLLPSLSSDK